MTNDNTTEPQALLDSITGFVANAKEAAERGEEVDLTGLDDRIQELCNGLLDIPREEAQGFMGKLQALNSDLTELRQHLEVMRENVQEKLNTLNAQQKAARAYKKPTE